MSNRYNLRDYSTPYNYHFRNDQLVREYQIAIENMNLVRRELSECVRNETVNQFVYCRDLREKYYALCQDRYHGMLLPPDHKVTDRSVRGLGPLMKWKIVINHHCYLYFTAINDFTVVGDDDVVVIIN